MKVVIDIPEKIYRSMKMKVPMICGRKSGKTTLSICLGAIALGKPLEESEKEQSEKDGD